MAHQKRIFATLCLIVATIQVAHVGRQVASAQDNFASLSGYDPELGHEGIPLLRHPLRYQQAGAQRRNSDFDDNAEEDDDDERDEYKSGSSNHDSYENPAFGESRRAAKDGEDIESFFDKHIGPQDSDPASSSNDDGIRELPDGGQVSSVAPVYKQDPDDYEAAASSPLSSIFHSLLNHAHKNKLIITTTDSGANSDQAAGASGQHALGASSATAASPIGSSSRDSAYVEATPIAYFTPIAASSQYDATGARSVGYSSESQDDDGPVREIYISRRPLLDHYQPSSMSGQSSNANWRGAYAQSSRPYYQQQVDYGSALPVAASYAYNNREQPAQPEDEQTVSYGLSFGASADDSDGSGANSDEQAQGQGQTEEPQASYNPYAARSNAMRHSSSVRYYQNYNYAPQLAQGHTRAQSYGQAAGEQQQYYPQQAYQGSMYHRDPSESTSQPVPAGYNQYRKGSNSAPPQGDARQHGRAEWARRQKLLANLDRQIKENPHYRLSAAATSYRTSGQRAPLAAAASKSPQQQYAGLGGEPAGKRNYDGYGARHQDADPLKSLTSASQLLGEPTTMDGQVSAQLRSNVSSQTVPLAPKPTSAAKGSAILQATPTKVDASQESNEPKTTSAKTSTLTGPVVHFANDDLLRHLDSKRVHLRFRRDDSDDREDEEDGVWVDDDEDDADNKQQSSDLSETAQEPEDEEAAGEEADENQPQALANYGPSGAGYANPPGVIGGPHGYELSPNDLMIYHG